MIQIREANIEDAEDIAMLGRKTFDQSFRHVFVDITDLSTYLEATFSIQKIQNSIRKKENVYWLVFENKKPIGYAKLKLDSPSEFVNSSKVSKLQKIYLLQGTSSKGIGTTLQQKIFDRSLANGDQYLWLSALKQNTRALEFYEKHRYQKVGEHPFVIGKQTFDFWVMRKKIK